MTTKLYPMKIKTLLALTGTLVAVTGMGIAAHKAVIHRDQAMSELVQLNLEALTSAETNPTKAAEKNTNTKTQEFRNHWTDGYNHYDDVIVKKTTRTTCSGIGYVDCTPSNYVVETGDPYTEKCPYKSEWECRNNHK